jgi:hypothetical protein
VEEMGTKINLKQYNTILSYLKDIELNGILNKLCGGQEDEYKILIKYLVNSIINVELFDKLIENDNLIILRDKVGQNVRLFLNFLDFNNDGKVQLVVKNDIDDNYTFGNDVPMIIKDIDINQIDKQVTNILTSLILYMRSDEYIEANEKFSNFYESCKITHNYFKLNFKNILIVSFDTIISLVILLCIISIPILNLIKQRIELLNNSDANIIITHDEIIDTINKMYGINVNCILLLVHTIVEAFVELNNKTKLLSKVFTCACSKK